jgi:hypothetical protein
VGEYICSEGSLGTEKPSYKYEGCSAGPHSMCSLWMKTGCIGLTITCQVSVVCWVLL